MQQGFYQLLLILCCSIDVGCFCVISHLYTLTYCTGNFQADSLAETRVHYIIEVLENSNCSKGVND